MPLTERGFQTFYPLIAGWIQKTLAEHASAARSVAALGFRRLPYYFDPHFLVSSKAVVVERVPVPPLAAMGRARLSEFEHMDVAGITYLDTYFVRADHAHVESLHFHELIHVIQWQLLGPEKFLALYAEGLVRFGYHGCPLEVMSYDFQGRFEREMQVFDVQAACRKRMRELTGLRCNPANLDGP